jgi:uncharacterized protein
MTLSAVSLVQKIEELASAIGSDMKTLAGISAGTVSDAQLAARIAALDAQWQNDMTTILSAQESMRALLQGAIGQTAESLLLPTTTVSATGIASNSSTPYAGSHLPAGFVYGSGGIDRSTGKWIGGWQHCAQSIYDILSTPIGTRVMRRSYGSRLFDLIDRPMTIENVMECYLAVAEALENWEPRFTLRNARVVEATSQGRMSLAIYGNYFPRGHLGDFTTVEEPDGVLVDL